MTKRIRLAPSLRFDVWRRDGFCCTYCGISATESGVVLHVDHIYAVARGGSNAIDNLTTACAPCNFKKGARPLAGDSAPQPIPFASIRARNRVKALRMERGMSVAALARQAGISPETVFKIERDNGHPPRGRVILALCKALDETDVFWFEAVS